FRAGGSQIFLMHPDGSDVTQLTSLSTDSFSPALSPDGTRVAFVHDDADGSDHIWVMDIDGSAMTQLTFASGNQTYPTWAPDSSRIAYVATMTNANDTDIWEMNADGMNQHNLTNDPIDAQSDPDWSHVTNQIAYTDTDGHASDIWEINADGTRRRDITN